MPCRLLDQGPVSPEVGTEKDHPACTRFVGAVPGCFFFMTKIGNKTANNGFFR